MRNPYPTPARRALAGGGAAGLASLAALALAGRRDAGSVAAPINAPSHALWGERALRRDDASLRYTGTGAAIHLASGLFWGVVHERLCGRRAARSAGGALAAAACTTAVAAAVDLLLVPERLTPGFQHRLSKPGLAFVYAAFGVGLALGSRWRARRH